MKRLSLFLLFATIAFPLFAGNETSENNIKILAVLIVALLVVVTIAAHMVYNNFFSGKFRIDYTVAEFEALRKEEGLAALTKQEVEELDNQLDEIDNIWGEIVDTAGDLVCYPHKYSSVNQSVAIVERVVAAHPANKTLVEKINTTNELLNHSLSRQFTGSKLMIAVAVIVAVVVGLFTDTLMVLAVAVAGVVLYVFASRTPNFMLISQLAKGRESLKSPISRVLSSLFMGVATAKSHKREVINSDGTKTTKTDNSERWVNLAVAITASLLFVLLMPLVTLVNYTRNYLLYR